MSSQLPPDDPRNNRRRGHEAVSSIESAVLRESTSKPGGPVDLDALGIMELKASWRLSSTAHSPW